MEFLSGRGVRVAAIEVIYFAPVILLTFAPSLAALRRWSAALTRRVRSVLAPPAADLVAAERTALPTLTVGRAAFRIGGVIALVAMCLVAAELYLRESRAVAWLERSMHESVAVHMARRMPTRLH
jgi:hypothetical protein